MVFHASYRFPQQYRSAEAKVAASRRRRRYHALACFSLYAFPLMPGIASEQEAQPRRTASTQAMAEAWWTGPVSASSAYTLPRGHLLVEPYLFDVRSRRSDYLGSLTYILYGLSDDLTLGAIPTFGGTRSRNGRRSRRIDINDLTITAQFRVRGAAPSKVMPAVSLVIQHSFPLGRFDKLGNDRDRGIGSGVNATLVGLYAQRVDRLPNGRPFRTRINITRSVSWGSKVHDESVFGTPRGFAGSVRSAGAGLVDLSIEYSMSQRWVLAADIVAHWSGGGRVKGAVDASATAWMADIASSANVSVAPAIEYSWSSTRGVLLGLRLSPEGRNASASVTPVIAFNAVF